MQNSTIRNSLVHPANETQDLTENYTNFECFQHPETSYNNLTDERKQDIRNLSIFIPLHLTEPLYIVEIAEIQEI